MLNVLLAVFVTVLVAFGIKVGAEWGRMDAGELIAVAALYLSVLAHVEGATLVLQRPASPPSSVQ